MPAAFFQIRPAAAHCNTRSTPRLTEASPNCPGRTSASGIHRSDATSSAARTACPLPRNRKNASVVCTSKPAYGYTLGSENR